MEVAAVLAALSTLRAGRPGLVMEFNTGHTSFGFRSTEPETLQFLSSVDYVRSVGFSIGLHGRELQDEHFFGYIAIAGAASAMVTAPSLRQPSPAATSIEALSLTHYEAAERPPVGPLLHGIHLLAALRDLTLDCEITLLELAPLAACSFLTKLTIDLLTVRPQAPAPDPPPADWNPGPAIDADGGGGVAGGLGVVNGGFGGGPWSAEAAAAAAALPQVRSLTLGSESHPAQLLAEVFPGLTELICVPCTRTVGVYNTFHCGLMLGGATCLTRLMLNCVVAAEAPAILAYATALTALAFTHANNVSTAGLLCAAAELPQLRRLALWDHEEADEYLAIRGILTQPQLQVYQQPQPQLPPEAAAVGGSALLFPHLEELEVRATSPEFFDEIVALLAMGTLQFVIRQDPVGCYGPGGGGSGGGGCGAIGGGEGGNSGGVRRARLDACFDPPLLRVGQLRELLAALGPCLRHAVVSGWATPGSEAALLQLGRDIGRPELVMGYEYPIL
ncbi:hypothetical protein Vretifemale_19250 [Volvox reticuliferus]|nr:hypothetical protein Vretifemale_19250 [Volvox reticuliferus]